MKLPSRFKKLKSLDDGGMSEAILCEDGHLEPHVVIKSLKAGADPKRLLAEVRALQAIRSRHVVQIYDVIRDPSGAIVAIVEEYVEGSDLTVLAPPTDAKSLMELLYPIARGISEIHAHGHIHRDIKRQNMRFDGEDCLKIFDFGLAKDDTDDASTIGAIGTPGYMAPELFTVSHSGETLFTSAVDVFAFGATAIALAKGKLPDGLKGKPPKLPAADASFSALSVGLPTEVASMLDGCMAESAANRPSMQEVADLLALHLLRDQHRAFVGFNGSLHLVDSGNRVVDISVQGQGGLRVTYDGLRFIASNVQGRVAINNMIAFDGMTLPGSCLIVLGQPYPAPRTSVTFDTSHPEIGA